MLLSQARITNDQSNLRLGIEVASHVIERDLACHNIADVLEALLLRSQMYADSGDEQNSLSDVIQALELSEPEGFISVFVEEGKPVAEALKLILERGLRGKVQPAFIHEILAAFPQTLIDPAANPIRETIDQSMLIEPLTDREMDVLRLISTGDSNQAIAEKLFISVSAVKKHTSNILGKLIVTSRTHAVARARQLKLLPIDE